MLKDWDFYRSMFIAEEYNRTSSILDQADNEIESPIEKIAYLQIQSLRRHYGIFNFIVRWQQKIEKYRVDFYITYHDKRIVVECDGHDFHEKTKYQASRDKERDRDLQKQGSIVLRYSGSDIINNPSKISDDIFDILGVPEWAVNVMKGEQEVKN